MQKQMLFLAMWLSLEGCEEAGFVRKDKYDASQAQLKKTQEELQKSQEELKKAQQQLLEVQTHKYQIYTQGWRTWRLDSATGKTCILLTSQQDWKRPETTPQGCPCEDAMNDPQMTFDGLQARGCFGKTK
jgi:hypothetical protein